MKKIIKLTESDLTMIVKRVISESDKNLLTESIVYGGVKMYATNDKGGPIILSYKGKKIKSTQASTTSAVIINSWADMNFTPAQEKEVIASLIARFKDFNLYSNQDIINNFNKAMSNAKTPEEKNKLIELLNCK